MLFFFLFNILSYGAQASFLISCNDLVSNVAVDPIINPGTQSAHQHTFFGSNAISQNTSSGNDLRKGQCFTCSGGDKSAYWIPTLLWQYENGTIQTAKVKNSMAAYWSNSIRGTGIPVNVNFFPTGLKYLAGNSSATTEKDAAPYYWWSCGQSLSQGTKQWPSSTCVDYIRLSIDLPDCWNGKDLFLAGSKHMAYSNSNGHCPSGFLRMWSLRLEFDHYIESSWQWNAENPPRFLLGDVSMKSPYKTHADFFNGFSKNEQQSIMNKCGMLEPDFCHLISPAAKACTPLYISPFMVIR